MEYPLQQAYQQIKNQLEQVLADFSYPSEVKLEIPPEQMGDFAFPCFHLAPHAKQSPADIAKKLKEKLHTTDWIERIEATAGYVNFFLDTQKLIDATISCIHETKNEYGCLAPQHKKVIIEHTSANPNGPLHVGRARNPIIGDTMVRIYRAAGYKVESQYYLDDMGKQVGILAWGLKDKKRFFKYINEYYPGEKFFQDLNKYYPTKKFFQDLNKYYPAGSEKYSFKENVSDHQNVIYYQYSSNLMKKDEKILNKINEIVKNLEEGDRNTILSVHKFYESVLEGMKESLDAINISFDRIINESKFVKDNSVDYVIEKLKKSELCGKEEGAYYLDLKSMGIKGRNTKFFFLRNDGTSLYTTRDIAYHLYKLKHADILINVLGEDHKLESKQVEICLEIMGIEQKRLPKVIFYAFVSLPGGKMSTRRGRVVYLDDLIDECINRAYTEVKKRRGDELTEEKMKDIARIIGIGALRYNIIKVQPEKDIEFKWEDALNFEGNAAPFIQYAHARACSILTKNKKMVNLCDTSVLTNPSEINLIKKLAKFPLIIEEAYRSFKPHILPVYLNETASQFNQFYRDCPVLPEKNQALRNARLLLVSASAQVLRNGLDLLGITAPEEM